MVIVYILIAAAYLTLNYFIAEWFSEAAEDKGYGNFADRKYFWICFWLGFIGYLLVIALPDRGKRPAGPGELPKL